MPDNKIFLIKGTILEEYKGEAFRVIISKGITAISKGAFMCSGIAEVRLPKSLREIGEKAFSACANLRMLSIPKGVTKIGRRAFEFCVDLTEVKLPKGLKEIGDEAFRCCVSLKRVTLSRNTKTSETAFDGCSPNLIISYYED